MFSFNGVCVGFDCSLCMNERKQLCQKQHFPNRSGSVLNSQILIAGEQFKASIHQTRQEKGKKCPLEMSAAHLPNRVGSFKILLAKPIEISVCSN